MTRPFDRRFNHPRHGVSRETTWARAVSTFALAANGNYATLDLLAPFKTSGGVQQGVTVTRTHLWLSVTSGSAPADTFTWGLVRGQNTDVGANVAGAPTPDLDPYEDWLLWRTETACNTGSGADTYFPATNVWSFDVKAQRRLPELQMTYNLVVKRLTVTAATLNVVVTTSVLLKLP
jgi:hypothetical protein